MTSPEGPHVDWPAVRRVLLVRLRSIGDTVLMTPCLGALKQFRPDLEIAVASEPYAAPLLEGHPLIDMLLVVGRGFWERVSFVRRCRRSGFDLAFNMHGGPTASFLTALSGASHTIGYRDYSHSWMESDRAPAPDVILGRQQIHSVEQQLALLAWTGVPWPSARPKLTLAISESALRSARERLVASGLGESAFAIIAPAAADGSKQWPPNLFADVADHLADYWRLRSAVIAGPGFEALAEAVARSARAAPALITGLSLKELVAVISTSSLFVSCDSGPMHIAAALDRPLVVVFGSSKPEVWRPWTDSPYRVVESQTGTVDQIPVGSVIAAVDEVIESAVSAGLTLM